MEETKSGCASASTCSKESCEGCASAGQQKTSFLEEANPNAPVSYTHLRAHET